MNNERIEILNLIQKNTIPSELKPGRKLLLKAFSREGKFYHYKEEGNFYIFRTPRMIDLTGIYFRLDLVNSGEKLNYKLIPVFPLRVRMFFLILICSFMLPILYTLYSFGWNWKVILVFSICFFLIYFLLRMIASAFVIWHRRDVEEFLKDVSDFSDIIY